MGNPRAAQGGARTVHITAGSVVLEGSLDLPSGAGGMVLFAHGSGSSRHSPRNRRVADVLRQAGLATLLLDLLSAAEEEEDRRTTHLRFDLALLASRLLAATDWLAGQEETRRRAPGYFGASTGAGAALLAAAERPRLVRAVVSRGGRPDLAAAALPRVQAPTLLIVGGADTPVIELNRAALAALPGPKELRIVPGATHLFEERGALESVAALASDWFVRYLTPRS